MTIIELWNAAAKMAQDSAALSLILAVLGASLIEVSPVKVNPWTWTGKKLRKYLGISEIREELENSRRTRILRFDDELISHVRHRKDMFEAILVDCDAYERYCKAHKGYVNSIAGDSIEHIREVYHECKANGEFLLPDEKQKGKK